MKKLLFLFAAVAAVACGDNMQKKAEAHKMPTVTMELVTLGTTGAAIQYADANGGEGYGKVGGALQGTFPASALSAKEIEMNAGYKGYAPEVAFVNGEQFTMVAPVVTPDNFIVINGDYVYRYDLGIDEMTNEITLVGKYKL